MNEVHAYKVAIAQKLVKWNITCPLVQSLSCSCSLKSEAAKAWIEAVRQKKTLKVPEGIEVSGAQLHLTYHKAWDYLSVEVVLLKGPNDYWVSPLESDRPLLEALGSELKSAAISLEISLLNEQRRLEALPYVVS